MALPNWMMGYSLLCIEVFREPYLDEWACRELRLAGGGVRWVMGTARWHAFVWACTRESLIETDPGPLDAHVP